MALRKYVDVLIKDDATAKTKEPFFIYQNDKNLEIYFKLVDYKYRYSKNEVEMNLLYSLRGASAWITIVSPAGIETDQGKTSNDVIIEDSYVKFIVTPSLTDELEEIGKYKLQIHITDPNENAELTIPEIAFDVKPRLQGTTSEAILLLTDEGEILKTEDGIPMAVSGNGITISALPAKNNYTGSEQMAVAFNGVTYKMPTSLLKGADGVTPTIKIGTVTTLAPGSNATVTANTVGNTVTLNFGIPKGADGSGGGGDSHTHTNKAELDKFATGDKAKLDTAATHASSAHNYEPVITKNTAFNKNFGSSAGTVAEGNHSHSGYASNNDITNLENAKYDDVILSGTELSLKANGVVKKTVTLPSGGDVIEGHTHANKAELDKFVDGDKAKLDTASTHASSAHAPSTAQRNADITKEEIEAKLVGEISSHTHANSGSSVEVVDNLTSTSSTSALSANQGKVLGEKVNKNTSDLADIVNDTLSGKTFIYLTQDEYDILTDDEKKSELIVYGITDYVGTPNYDDSELRNILETKVDKINGKSLIDDSEIQRLLTLQNYDDTELREMISNKLTSPNGTEYLLKVSDDGTLTTEKIIRYGNIVLSETELIINELEGKTFTIHLDQKPTEPQTVTLTVDNVYCELSHYSLQFDKTNYNIPQEVTVTGNEVENDSNTIITLSTNNTNSHLNVLIVNVAKENEIIQDNLLLWIDARDYDYANNVLQDRSKNQNNNIQCVNFKESTKKENTLFFDGTNYIDLRDTNTDINYKDNDWSILITFKIIKTTATANNVFGFSTTGASSLVNSIGIKSVSNGSNQSGFYFTNQYGSAGCDKHLSTPNINNIIMIVKNKDNIIFYENDNIVTLPLPTGSIATSGRIHRYLGCASQGVYMLSNANISSFAVYNKALTLEEVNHNIEYEKKVVRHD